MLMIQKAAEKREARKFVYIYREVLDQVAVVLILIYKGRR
jgi:hypothetical protein